MIARTASESARRSQLAQIPLSFDRGAAAGAGGRDGLAIDMVGDVACGEDAGNVGARAAVKLDAAVIIEFEGAAEDLDVRDVSDGDEEPRGRRSRWSRR